MVAPPGESAWIFELIFGCFCEIFKNYRQSIRATSRRWSPSGECASPSGRRTPGVVVEFHVFCHKLFQLIDQVDIDKRLSKFDFLLFSC